MAKRLEIALIQLNAAEDKASLLEKRVAEKDQVIQAREDQIATQKEMIAFLKSANADRATANNGDARMLEACNQQLSKAEARIYKLEHPSVLSRLFNSDVLASGVVGFGIGRATAPGGFVQVSNPFSQFKQEPDRLKIALGMLEAK